MEVYGTLASRLLAPTLDTIRKCHCVSSLAELQASQWWQVEEIEALQRERLTQSIQHAYSHVPCYRHVMQKLGLRPGDIRAVSDLARLPVLTKSIVRSQTEGLIADNVARKALIRLDTGGSTGSPLSFFTTKHDRHSYGQARGLLAMEWAGITLGDKVVTFSAHYQAAPTWLERAIRPVSAAFRRETRVPLKSVTQENLDAAVRLLDRKRPKAIAGYPSTLALIASHIRDSGRPTPPLHAVLTGGEQVFEHQRTLIRDAFGVEPYSRYGTSENSLLATECEAHVGMHVFAQDLVLEIVDANGQPVSRGTEGRVLVTNLRARGMPFIRYDTGDVGSYSVDSCPCGRSMPLIDRLSGRRCDTIYTRSGARIVGNGVERDGFASLGVTQLQYVQEDLDHLTGRFVVPDAATLDAQRRFRLKAEDMLRQSLGPDIRITVEIVEHIEPTPAGKYVPVISKVDPDSWLNRSQS